MLTKVLLSVLCCLAVANAFEDYNYDVLDDLLMTEEAVEANYFEAEFISDMEIQAQVSLSLGKGPCDHPNAQHNDQGTNLCHFWGSLILQVYNLINAAIIILGLVGRLIQMVIPCVIQLGVKICLATVDFWGGVKELLTCALCAICKAFLPDFFCNMLGNLVEAVVNGASAIETESNGQFAMQAKTETEFIFAKLMEPVKKAYECFARNVSAKGSHADHATFGDDMRGDSGACGLIFKAISDVFTYFVEPPGETGGGNGSNEPGTKGCKPVVDGFEKISSLILRLITHTASCATCLHDAVTLLKGGGSGSGSGKKKNNPFGKGGGQQTFGIADAIMKIHTLFCCLNECNCYYNDIACSEDDDDFPKWGKRRGVAPADPNRQPVLSDYKRDPKTGQLRWDGPSLFQKMGLTK
jgi:hypothetical protein